MVYSTLEIVLLLTTHLSNILLTHNTVLNAKYVNEVLAGDKMFLKCVDNGDHLIPFF